MARALWWSTSRHPGSLGAIVSNPSAGGRCGNQQISVQLPYCTAGGVYRPYGKNISKFSGFPPLGTARGTSRPPQYYGRNWGGRPAAEPLAGAGDKTAAD